MASLPRPVQGVRPRCLGHYGAGGLVASASTEGEDQSFWDVEAAITSNLASAL
jgi:hypothetical protein